MTRSPAGWRGASPAPRTRPQGQLDQPQHLGADRCTPPHPSPRTHRLCPPPPDSAPASAVWHPKPTRLPHLSSPHPHSPSLSLPVKTALSLPDPAGVPHPLRDLQNHSFSLNWEKTTPALSPGHLQPMDEWRCNGPQTCVCLSPVHLLSSSTSFLQELCSGTVTIYPRGGGTVYPICPEPDLHGLSSITSSSVPLCSLSPLG